MKSVTRHLRLYLLGILALTTSRLWGQKTLELTDRTYEPQIKTVQCYPNQGADNDVLLASATRLEAQNLMLEFDDLRDQRSNYYVKLLHCNFDWTKSGLMDLDFVSDYNEFLINDYTFSINTFIPYVHYRYPIPSVKIPGNYVVIVYRDGNRQDLILSKRILVYQNRITLAQDDVIAGLGNIRETNQALNFVINYSGVEIINPLGNMHVTIRQNQRWDNAKQDIQPSFDREDASQLEYRFYDMDKTFLGGNEFRFVDFRSFNYPGQNTRRLDKTRKPFELYVNTDLPRGDQSYSQYADLDGSFYVNNTDYQDEPTISANYIPVNFTLQSSPFNSDVYVMGAFNGWRMNELNKMKYDQGSYSQKILLKQGFYNYQYWVDSKNGDGNQVEGNHFQTENLYEVLVYYRSLQQATDLLIGYFVIPLNPR